MIENGLKLNKFNSHSLIKVHRTYKKLSCLSKTAAVRIVHSILYSFKLSTVRAKQIRPFLVTTTTFCARDLVCATSGRVFVCLWFLTVSSYSGLWVLLFFDFWFDTRRMETTNVAAAKRAIGCHQAPSKIFEWLIGTRKAYVKLSDLCMRNFVITIPTLGIK